MNQIRWMLMHKDTDCNLTSSRLSQIKNVFREKRRKCWQNFHVSKNSKNNFCSQSQKGKRNCEKWRKKALSLRKNFKERVKNLGVCKSCCPRDWSMPYLEISDTVVYFHLCHEIIRDSSKIF